MYGSLGLEIATNQRSPDRDRPAGNDTLAQTQSKSNAQYTYPPLYVK